MSSSSLPVRRRKGCKAAERRTSGSSVPAERNRGLPSPSSVISIDPNDSKEKLRSTLGDGFVENFGIALVLFETPSGFAIFGFFVLHLYGPHAIENLWARFHMYERARNMIFPLEFQNFDDKSSAINVGTGVNRQLTEMIMKCYRPGQTLVVGKEEYKSIIESSLEIPCLYDGIVMELMWGIQHLMHRLVPQEKLELPKEDRVPMSQGLQMFLRRYDYHVKPEMVNEKIVSAASSLFHCDTVEKEEYAAFLRIARLLKGLSGIDYKKWGALSIASAFNIILTRKINDFDENFFTEDVKLFFTEDVKLKLLEDADKYKGKVNETGCLMAYKTLVSAHKRKIQDKIELSTLVYEAQRMSEASTKLRHASKPIMPQLNRCLSLLQLEYSLVCPIGRFSYS